jgi:hypothetical protein
MFCIFLAYGLLFLLPLKIKIQRNCGRILSNNEITKMAKEGHLDAKKLIMLTKFSFIPGALFVLLYALKK